MRSYVSWLTRMLTAHRFQGLKFERDKCRLYERSVLDSTLYLNAAAGRACFAIRIEFFRVFGVVGREALC